MVTAINVVSEWLVSFSLKTIILFSKSCGHKLFLTLVPKTKLSSDRRIFILIKLQDLNSVTG